jgi:hypothetical protein
MSEDTSQAAVEGDARATDMPVLAVNAEPATAPGRSAYVPISRVRLGTAVLVASLADTVGIPFGEAGIVLFDLAIALVLVGIIGFRRKISLGLVAAFLVEAIPGLGVFPSWFVAVMVIVAHDRKARRSEPKL